MLLNLLSALSSKNWSQKLRPLNDIEREKIKCSVLSIDSYPISKFHDEGQTLSNEICRNILGFLNDIPLNKTNKSAGELDVLLLSQIAVQNSESMLQILTEVKSFEAKISDLNNVSLDEINEVTAEINASRSEELSMKQCQQLYVRQVQQRITDLSKRIRTQFSTIVLIIDTVETSVMLFVHLWKATQNDDCVRLAVTAVESICSSDIV